MNVPKKTSLAQAILITALCALTCLAASSCVSKSPPKPEEKPAATAPITQSKPTEPAKKDARIPVIVAVFSDLSDSGERLGEKLAVAMNTEIGISAVNIRQVEREQLESIIKQMETSFELSAAGLLDESTAVKVGGLSGVKYMVFGTVGAFGDVWQITWRIVSVETGSVLKAGKGRGAKAELPLLAEKAAAEIDSFFAGK